jgi:hypothetical protein
VPQDELKPNHLLEAVLKDFERGRILRAAGVQDVWKGEGRKIAAKWSTNYE